MFELRTVIFLFVMTYILSVQSQGMSNHTNNIIIYELEVYDSTNIFICNCFSPDNIFTISPNSICIGELVIITCYLFPPTANGYNTFALLSFNGSTPPQPFNDINNDFGSIGYVATVAIPVMGDSARIQLSITSFQVSDSNTLFGCHAVLNSDGSSTGVIESGTVPLAG